MEKEKIIIEILKLKEKKLLDPEDEVWQILYDEEIKNLYNYIITKCETC